MMTEREIFLEALDVATPEARLIYVQEACGRDVALHQKVEALLREHFSNDSLLAGSALDENRGNLVESRAGEAPAQIIGRYKLLEKIGEGGFGEVWMAEQREPVRRRVALKLIKLGMDSRQIVARFEAERQALAMMDHPNIARILDAGTTQEGVAEKAECRIPPTQATASETDPFQLVTHNPTHHSPLSPGRPYFVMELVRGLKITDYCDQNGLSTQDRLRLFIPVCQAIQHAHQKGIVHRDIKPSNVLVTLHDGVPVPKVIDFGIAKATQGELTVRTVFTQFLDEAETLSTVSTNHLLRFWDVATRTLQRSVPLPGITDSTQRFLFAVRGNRLAAVDDASLIRVHDTSTGRMIGSFRAWVKSVDWRHPEGLRFSPDARLLATVESGEVVKVWELATQKEWNSLPGHKEPAQGLAFSPDGSLLASASYDGNVRLLRVATGTPEAPLSGIKEGCSGVAFSPDARTVSVACEDGTVRLWNVATKREVAVLKHGKAPVRMVTFASDGQTLVGVCENGTLRFWDAPHPEAR